ncbi:hypothetical protein FXO38_32159 [Capsicum annuum]|nr:hypothetical protein FXO38_32159 [Capsicum annuum]KAF3621685.1 hypothetical protein FXO37_32674 [Capsicum annuum]
MFHSDSSTAASIRRRTNPTATPTRVKPVIMEAILKISEAALQVEDKAPPPLACDDGVLNELTIFAKDCSVDIGRPNEATWLFAFSPPNEFNPSMYFTLVAFWKDFLPVPIMAVELTVAAENVVIVAIVF